MAATLPRAFCFCALLLLPALPAYAQPFVPSDFRAAVKERPTRVLVLASPHLAQLEGPFDTAWLEPLLDRLQRFAPAAIMVEALPVEALHGLSAYEALYPGVADLFGRTRLRLAREASARLGLSMPAAEGEARRLLERLPADPAPAERRRLGALLIAAGDLDSAVLHWLRLAPEERLAHDGIGAEAASHLDRLAESRNERVAIAARLAARLGLDRLHAIDDHSDSDLFFSAAEAVAEAEQGPALSAARARRPAPSFALIESPESALAAYRAHNSEEAGRRDAEHQWLARLEAETHRDIHRRRVAAWEVRNLRMAANIREASALHPGRNLLVIVGSAHKPYLDAYLRAMSDVELVPAPDVLGGSD
jgi:hypothetical protein